MQCKRSTCINKSVFLQHISDACKSILCWLCCRYPTVKAIPATSTSLMKQQADNTMPWCLYYQKCQTAQLAQNQDSQNASSPPPGQAVNEKRLVTETQHFCSSSPKLWKPLDFKLIPAGISQTWASAQYLTSGSWRRVCTYTAG